MKYKVGDPVKIKDSIFDDPIKSDNVAFLKGAWGLVAKTEMGIMFEHYYVFFPQYPAETEETEPTVLDLSYILYEVELEPLDEILF